MDHAAPQSPAALSTSPSWLLNQTASHAARLLSEGFAAHDLRGYHYRLLATSPVTPTWSPRSTRRFHASSRSGP
ncbi:hypothetical protein ABZU52_21965, partial [Micromonospora sp. NPDC005220]